MNDLPPRQLLQPALLDRLTDLEPREKQEPGTAALLSTSEFRESVLRDLRWLLGTVNLESHPSDLGLSSDAFPHVTESVLNYGMPEVSGRMLSTAEREALPEIIRHAISRFEPRIDPDTLEVTVRERKPDEEEEGIALEIAGELWGYPAPEYLLVETRVNLSSGALTILGGEER